MSTTAVPSKLPEDFALNIDNLDKFSNSTSPTFIDRLGISKRTLAGVDAEAEARMNANDGTEAAALAVRESLSTTQRNNFQSAADLVLAGAGYAPPVAYTAGLSMTLPVQTVNYLGQTYAPILSVLPFTTSGTFEAAKFRLIQGVAAVDLAAAGGAVLIGANTYQTQNDLNIERVSVKRFGAKGDGITNDTNAFAAASAAINAAGGGILYIPPGNYIVGKQTFAGATGKGYAYKLASIIDIRNCTKPVVIEGYGAVLKMENGLKFGSFDPVTGAVYNPTLPFINSDYAADIGVAIYVNNNVSVVIRGMELDGNSGNIVLGGQWGDKGYQRWAYGIHAFKNTSLRIEDVYTHHHGTDGVVIGYAGAVRSTPMTTLLMNVRSEYNARQGCSWVGGVNLTAMNCQFNHTGRGAFSSSPAAGLDIEAESALIRNGLFINCEMINCVGLAMGADSGDSADVQFTNCTFVGTSYVTLWPRKPGFKFTGCKIYGHVFSQYAHIDPNIANSFTSCLFTDAPYGSYTTYATNQLFGSVTSAPVYFSDCVFTTTKTKIGRLDYFVLANCRFSMQAGTGFVPNQAEQITLTGAVLTDCTFDSNITVNPPDDAHHIFLGSGVTTNGKNTLTNTAGIVLWSSWSVAGGGFIGELGKFGKQAGSKQGVNALSLFPNQYVTQYYGTIDIYATAVAPTTGTYKRGDRCINQAPAVGQSKGWICTVAGTPGTWVSEGVL